MPPMILGVDLINPNGALYLQVIDGGLFFA